MIVVADTSPLRYLVLIDEIHLLPILYSRVLIPSSVISELSQSSSPRKVASWIATPPTWLDILRPQFLSRTELVNLDQDERDAIELALQMSIDTVIIDEALGRRAAEAPHLTVRGTIGILVEAARLGLVDIRSSLARLEQQRFYLGQGLIQRIMDDFSEEGTS